MWPLPVLPIHRLLRTAPLAGVVLARAALAQDPAPAPLTVTGASSVWTAPGVELQYTQAPGAEGKPGPALLRSVIDAGASRLRTDLRIDPNAASRDFAGVDLSWEPLAVPLRNLVLGDSYAKGAGWSQPARLTGVRFGSAVAVRAPLRVDAAPAFAPSAFTASQAGTERGDGVRAARCAAAAAGPAHGFGRDAHAPWRRPR